MKTIINQFQKAMQNEEFKKKLIAMGILIGTTGILICLHKHSRLYASEGERILRIMEKLLATSDFQVTHF